MCRVTDSKTFKYGVIFFQRFLSALQDTIPKLINMLKLDNLPDDMTLNILLALSNFAVLSDWHSEFFPVLHTAYQIVDKGSPAIKLQVLKLLINLSCNEDMIPSLLAAQVSVQRYFQ